MHVYIRGKRAVIEAIIAHIPLEKLLFAEHYQEKESIIQELKKISKPDYYERIPIETVSRDAIEKITGEDKRTGVVARVQIPETQDLRTLIGKILQSGEVPFFAILDHLEDPHNVGAVIRSAEGAGVHGVILPKWRSAGITGTVVQSSAGAVFHIPLVEVSNIAHAIDLLKKNGIWIIGTASDMGENYTEMDMNIPLAVVIGSEGEGMKRLVKDKCDFFARIPMMGKIDSLNASATAAVVFYEVVRQRGKRNNGS